MLHPLQVLRDRIVDSQEYRFWLFLSEDEIRLLRKYIPEFQFYIKILNSFSIVSWTTLNILDYDDTIHQRGHQLQKWLLQDNRWLAWNQIIDTVIWRANMLDVYYRRSAIVKRIAQILEMQDDFHQSRIVTAWNESWQIQKTIHSWVYDRNKGIEVVPDASLKIRSVMQEITRLWYIPSKIIIYEDRPEHFQKIAVALSKFLWWIEIVVNHVVLSQQEVIRRQIASIHQTIYSPSV